jgi:putative membrane protein
MKPCGGRTALSLAALVAVASILSCFGAASKVVWFTEMFWAWGLVAVLAVCWRWMKFSTTAYACLFVWCILQTIGAHYEFEHVPMDWLMSPLGLVRNPFDRIAHFTVGFVALPLAELYWRKGYASSRISAAFFAVATTIAMAGLWELVEWQYAIIDGGEAGAAFLGSQGDEWDAQKDILCDTLGALCAVTVFLAGSRKSKSAPKESEDRNV